ncbi:hypothetical protein [Rhodopila sp.]|jgi:hypothetical protein|uniref:hypothetical protein n=1 Tax=Rhodopila sp. TaxID=2480087 RepID=UPI002C63E437|nr:hypothetical protein [Rhodopila sp.]HVZ10066.1 hypothetical protein [Rhodopila sp.]
MSEDRDLALLDHELAADEIAWMQAVYDDFAAARSDAADPKEVLRHVLAQPRHRLPAPMDLTGPGPWRGGRNRHGRNVTAVFLPRVELHRHARSRTDQFAIYVRGEADAFSLDADGQPVLTPVEGGSHFHNAPDAPHAFLPKVGKPVPDDWEIAFIAITPRNLKEDTQSVPADVKAAYTRVTGREAPGYV